MKVYIKSAVNISDIQAKMAKKQAEIDKKLAWIQKKEASIQKGYAIVQPALSEEEFARVQTLIDYLKGHNSYNYPEEYQIYDIRRRFEWGDPVEEALSKLGDDAESIYNSRQAIDEAQKILDNYKSKIAALKAKGEELDRIPDCLKEFKDDLVRRWDEYDYRIKNEGKPYYYQLTDEAWNILYGEGSTGMPSIEKAKLAELYPDIEENTQYGYFNLRRKQFDKDYIIYPFERKYGSLNYAKSIWNLDDARIHSDNERAGENLILDLLKRVTKITGPVIDWSGLHVTRGNLGAVINGYVVGEDGKVEVESILAGGYAIQRLHIRTLVKPIK